jgi:hypothetical protein
MSPRSANISHLACYRAVVKCILKEEFHSIGDPRVAGVRFLTGLATKMIHYMQRMKPIMSKLQSILCNQLKGS